MNKIVLIYFNNMSGTITSLLDFFITHSDYECILILQDLSFIFTYNKYLPKGIYKTTINKFLEKEWKFDVIFTSVSFLKNLDFSNVKYKEITFIDSNTIFSSHISNPSFFSLLKSIPNKIIIANKFNSNILKLYNIDSSLGYHKIAKKRLDSIISNSKYGQYSVENPIFVNRGIVDNSPHLHDSFYYHRHTKIGDFYFENIGKLIFEFLYFGKPVFYSPNNKSFDDGLTEYLDIIGIDDNKEQIIRINNIDILLY